MLVVGEKNDEDGTEDVSAGEGAISTGGCSLNVAVAVSCSLTAVVLTVKLGLNV